MNSVIDFFLCRDKKIQEVAKNLIQTIKPIGKVKELCVKAQDVNTIRIEIDVIRTDDTTEPA